MQWPQKSPRQSKWCSVKIAAPTVLGLDTRSRRPELVGNEVHDLGGTGKFEGLEGGRTYQLAFEWPNGKAVATWDGTGTLK
jgi:hypothetical protein